MSLSRKITDIYVMHRADIGTGTRSHANHNDNAQLLIVLSCKGITGFKSSESAQRILSVSLLMSDEAHTQTYVYSYTYNYKNAYTYTYTHARTRMGMRICVHTRLRIRVHLRTFTYMLAYVDSHDVACVSNYEYKHLRIDYSRKRHIQKWGRATQVHHTNSTPTATPADMIH